MCVWGGCFCQLEIPAQPPELTRDGRSAQGDGPLVTGIEWGCAVTGPGCVLGQVTFQSLSPQSSCEVRTKLFDVDSPSLLMVTERERPYLVALSYSALVRTVRPAPMDRT